MIGPGPIRIHQSPRIRYIPTLELGPLRRVLGQPLEAVVLREVVLGELRSYFLCCNTQYILAGLLLLLWGRGEVGERVVRRFLGFHRRLLEGRRRDAANIIVHQARIVGVVVHKRNGAALHRGRAVRVGGARWAAFWACEI